MNERKASITRFDWNQDFILMFVPPNKHADGCTELQPGDLITILFRILQALKRISIMSVDPSHEMIVQYLNEATLSHGPLARLLTEPSPVLAFICLINLLLVAVLMVQLIRMLILLIVLVILVCLLIQVFRSFHAHGK